MKRTKLLPKMTIQQIDEGVFCTGKTVIPNEIKEFAFGQHNVHKSQAKDKERVNGWCIVMPEWSEKEYIPLKRRGKLLVITIVLGLMAWGILHYGYKDQDTANMVIGYVFALFTVLGVLMLIFDRAPNYKLTPKGVWTSNFGIIPWTSIERLNLITDRGGRTIPRTRFYSVRLELRDYKFLSTNNVKPRVTKFTLKYRAVTLHLYHIDEWMVICKWADHYGKDLKTPAKTDRFIFGKEEM